MNETAFRWGLFGTGLQLSPFTPDCHLRLMGSNESSLFLKMEIMSNVYQGTSQVPDIVLSSWHTLAH